LQVADFNSAARFHQACRTGCPASSAQMRPLTDSAATSGCRRGNLQGHIVHYMF
jgi:hypothetical protein